MIIGIKVERAIDLRENQSRRDDIYDDGRVILRGSTFRYPWRWSFNLTEVDPQHNNKCTGYKGSGLVVNPLAVSTDMLYEVGKYSMLGSQCLQPPSEAANSSSEQLLRAGLKSSSRPCIVRLLTEDNSEDQVGQISSGDDECLYSVRQVRTPQILRPPPPKLCQRKPTTQCNGVHRPALSNLPSDTWHAAQGAIHVVSGLKRGITPPVPLANRTMANGDFGDDAAFFVETTGTYVLGISDGAGGNRGHGFDPRNFSRQLMRHCADYILARNDDCGSTKQPPSQTVFAALQMCQDRNIYGSGTICVCSFDKATGDLHTINIGDSGFMVIRNGQIHKEGKRTYRNDGSQAPVQLDVYPWSFSNRAKFMVETNEIGDIEEMKDCIGMRSGDLLIMASDGVFDSISQDVILSTIVMSVGGHSDDWQHPAIKEWLTAAADAVVTLASRNTENNAPDDVIVVLAMFH